MLENYNKQDIVCQYYELTFSKNEQKRLLINNRKNIRRDKRYYFKRNEC